MPLAFHVDYWHYFGWCDRFVAMEWTARRQTYAVRWDASSVEGLGFALTADVAAVENRGLKLSNDFVVLSLQKAPLPADASEVKFKIANSRPGKIGARAAWISYPCDPTSVQAIGGWLPK